MYQYSIFLCSLFTAITHATILHVTNSKQLHDELRQHTAVVVDFYAEWCQPCKRVSPLLQSLSQEYSDVRFIKVNIEFAKSLQTEYQVTAVPTLLFFKQGTKVDTLTGLHDLSEIRKKIECIRSK